MIFAVGAVNFLICDFVVICVCGIGFGWGGEKEEGEFECSGGVDVKGVVVCPLWSPGFLDMYWLRRKGGGDGVKVPHLVVMGFIFSGLVVGGGCLIDEPDFYGVIDKSVFVVYDTDFHGCVFPCGEVSWVSFCFACLSEEVEFGECLPGFGDGDDIDKGRNRYEDDDHKNHGERSVDFVFLFWERQLQRYDETFLCLSLSPSIDAEESDAENKEKKGEEERFKSYPPGGVIQQKYDEWDHCYG